MKTVEEIAESYCDLSMPTSQRRKVMLLKAINEATAELQKENTLFKSALIQITDLYRRGESSFEEKIDCAVRIAQGALKK